MAVDTAVVSGRILTAVFDYHKTTFFLFLEYHQVDTSYIVTFCQII